MFITILYNIVDSLIQLNSDIIYIYIKKEEKKKKGKIRKRRNKKIKKKKKKSIEILNIFFEHLILDISLKFSFRKFVVDFKASYS